MLSVLRRHMNPATAMAFAALVFAMTGGAYAVTGHGGGSGSKATASVTATAAKSKGKPKGGARGPAGPKGATGATGSAGPAGPAGATGPVGGTGPQGAAGTNGSNGETGKTGEPGAPGAKGKSVVSAAFEGTSEPAGEPCKKGGGNSVEVEGSGKKTYACNGSPWSVGGTLPPGKSETGTWAWKGAIDEAGTEFFSISLPIPLAAPLSGAGCPEGADCHVHFINEEEPPPAGCAGGRCR